MESARGREDHSAVPDPCFLFGVVGHGEGVGSGPELSSAAIAGVDVLVDPIPEHYDDVVGVEGCLYDGAVLGLDVESGGRRVVQLAGLGVDEHAWRKDNKEALINMQIDGILVTLLVASERGGFGLLVGVKVLEVFAVLDNVGEGIERVRAVLGGEEGAVGGGGSISAHIELKLIRDGHTEGLSDVGHDGTEGVAGLRKGTAGWVGGSGGEDGLGTTGAGDGPRGEGAATGPVGEDGGRRGGGEHAGMERREGPVLQGGVSRDVPDRH